MEAHGYGDGRASFEALLTTGSDRSIRPFAAGSLGQFWPRCPQRMVWCG